MGLASALINAETTIAQEPLNLGATLVQVPVIVTEPGGKFVDTLEQKDFAVFEDGKRQEISFFGTLKQPFTAALVLDTSNSSEARLSAIQRLAIGFTRE